MSLGHVGRQLQSMKRRFASSRVPVRKGKPMRLKRFARKPMPVLPMPTHSRLELKRLPDKPDRTFIVDSRIAF
jgi:hypothetical protein